MPKESPSSNAGRKSVGDTTYITISLTQRAFTLLSEGSDVQANLTNKKASKASWFRLLLDHLKDTTPSKLLTSEELEQRWPLKTQDPPSHKLTVMPTFEQLIYIRQVECAIQALDWTRHIGRNEACSILIELEGSSLNVLLQTQLKRAT